MKCRVVNPGPGALTALALVDGATTNKRTQFVGRYGATSGHSQTRDKQLSALCPRLVLGVWALDRGAVFAQWRGCLPGALSRSQEPRDREQLTTTTLIHRCNGLSARRWIRDVASHGAPREWCFEQRRAAVFWYERHARARMRVALTDRYSDFLCVAFELVPT